MNKRIFLLLALSAFVVSMIFPASASELPDVTRPGSLEIVMEYEGEPLQDGSLTICRVGDIETKDGYSSFVLVDALTGGPSLEELHDPNLGEVLADLARERALPMVREDIREGRVRFADLEPGLYVVIQQEGEASEGFAPIRPFLLSLPVWAEGAYQYDLEAVPKVPLETEPTIPTTPTTPTEPPEPNLPQTGQLNWPIPLLCVAGAVLILIGLILMRKKHHE